MKQIFIATLLALGLFAQEIYKVGTGYDYPPFDYIENGEIVGFEIDLVRAVAKELNIQVEPVTMPFDGLIAALKVGKIDIISAGMSYTSQRAKNAEFTKSIFDSKNYYLKLKGNDKINSLDDLSNGAIIGAKIGTLQADEITNLKGVKPYLNEEYIVLINSTLNGKIDGFVMEEPVAKSYMKKYPNLEVFATSSIEGMSLAFKKGNTKLRDDFDKTIEKFKQDGTYLKLLEKYNLN
ncbi:transporter substrate-binding domain-containing protein [Campylobacter sp. RM12640]|uniref:substrate-binding periplasmic protein n=1 Tax=unclassified Campylobacter TaxID=2593542 RepID=UPI001DE7258E|nr:transporter substrate-binding domain-containing protein [Campylobacter sp. RM12640]MBZ7988271.1 transporter substrate-binding domain-containing protein [Campylobacter sp. RM12635]MBZ7993083.1 transporter substrate-binding domain-containing protein [Campylobacter sp. RM9333]